jgi:hypothetical protein
MNVSRPTPGVVAYASFTLAGALSGAVLGAVVQAELTGTGRLVEMVVGVLCLATIGSTAAMLGMTRSTKKALDDFAQVFDITIRSQSVRAVNSYRSPADDLVVHAFRHAKEEILSLDQLTDQGVRPDIQIHPNVMSWHLEAILERVKSADVRYVRYCQVSDTTRPFPFATENNSDAPAENAFAEHCIGMCELQATGHNVSLRIAPNVFPYKFLIIDGSTLILQLQELCDVGQDVKEPRTRCELVIQDPRKILINQFMDMWKQLEDNRATRALDKSSGEIAEMSTWLRGVPTRY